MVELNQAMRCISQLPNLDAQTKVRRMSIIYPNILFRRQVFTSVIVITFSVTIVPVNEEELRVAMRVVSLLDGSMHHIYL